MSVDREGSLGKIFAVSTPSKFSLKYFRLALAISAHYLVQLKGGAFIHGKTFGLLKTVKTQKFSAVNISPFTVYDLQF